MDFILREFNLNDLEEINNLNIQLEYDFPKEKLKERVEYLINKYDAKIFVAVHNLKVIAYIHGSAGDRIYDDKLFIIHTLVVDEEYRGLGVGNKLIAKIEEWIKANNYLSVGLWSRLDRTGAHRFYEKRGYINERTQKYYLKLF